MSEKQRALPETIGLSQGSWEVASLDADQGLVCRGCGTKIEDGRACGKNLSVAFWYCPTCDEFLAWHAFGITDEMTGQYQADLRSFLRWLKYHAKKDQGNNGGQRL